MSRSNSSMIANFDLAHPTGRRAWIRELLAPMDETRWDQLARKLFAWQFARVPAYRRLCHAQNISPRSLASWKEIPAVPQALFKVEKLYAKGLAVPAAIYETSGTTTGQPGRQHLANTDIYRAVSVAGARHMGLFALVDSIHFLTPSPSEAPHSSLSAMFGFWKKDGVQRGQFWMQKNRIDFDVLRAALLAQIKTGRPVGIAGTAFSFVHLIEAWAGLPPLRLPRGSWLLETGGFKGRSREIAKPELYRHLARIFSLREVDIYNEYGMSELSSQGYTHGLALGHSLPSWARVLVVDPATGREVRIGQKGLVRWFDLANTDSVMALQTLDVAVVTRFGYELIGRLPRTEPRGCSLSAEDLIGGSASGLTLTQSPLAQTARDHEKMRVRPEADPPINSAPTRQRIALLARAYPQLFPRAELVRLVDEQLGWAVIESGRVRPPRTIYHICAGNLAVSAWTSLAHGLLLGARNVVKLPGDRDDSTTRREILDFIRGLPTPLGTLIETHRTLDEQLLRKADAVIAFGSDTTMESLRQKMRWDQKFIAHGHAVSLLWIADPNKLTPREARACAIDVLTYDQLGCLSPQAIYVPPGTDIEKLGDKLSRALEIELNKNFAHSPGWPGQLVVRVAKRSGATGGRNMARGNTGDLLYLRAQARSGTRTTSCPGHHPKRPLGTAARIAEARDLAFALGHRVWLPPTKHLGWTIIHDPDTTFAPSPLHGTIILRQSSETGLAKALAPVAGRISTVGVAGQISSRLRKVFLSLGVSRFCPAGRMQFPPLTWHHDGRAPLAELVTWVDIENGG